MKYKLWIMHDYWVYVICHLYLCLIMIRSNQIKVRNKKYLRCITRKVKHTCKDVVSTREFPFLSSIKHFSPFRKIQTRINNYWFQLPRPTVQHKKNKWKITITSLITLYNKEQFTILIPIMTIRQGSKTHKQKNIDHLLFPPNIAWMIYKVHIFRQKGQYVEKIWHTHKKFKIKTRWQHIHKKNIF